VAELTAWLRHPWLITGVACLYGGAISTLYPLGVAYANDYIGQEQRVGVSAGLVLAFGVGAAMGAIPAGLLLNYLGPEGLFIYTATIGLALSGFIIYRSTRRVWVPIMDKEAFVALPVATSTPHALKAGSRNK
jgi:MFS family permease